MKDYLKTYFFDIIFKKFFDCTGKSTRKEFWLFTLNLLILISATYAIIYFDFPKVTPEILNKALNVYPSYDTIIFFRIILHSYTCTAILNCNYITYIFYVNIYPTLFNKVVLKIDIF